MQEVITVEAEDKDTGANGEVRYHLRIGENNLQDTPVFHLDPITGLLSTKLVLDREKQHKYEVRKLLDRKSHYMNKYLNDGSSKSSRVYKYLLFHKIT